MTLVTNALFKFIGLKHCFTYLKRRLPPSTVKNLDKLLTLKCRLIRLNLRIKLLQQCLYNSLVPKYLVHRIQRLKYDFNSDVCKNVLRTELANLRSNLASLRDDIHRLLCSLPASILLQALLFLLNISTFLLPSYVRLVPLATSRMTLFWHLLCPAVMHAFRTTLTDIL